MKLMTAIEYRTYIAELEDQITVTSQIVDEYRQACRAAAEADNRTEYNTYRRRWGHAKRSLETKQEQLANLH